MVFCFTPGTGFLHLRVDHTGGSLAKSEVIFAELGRKHGKGRVFHTSMGHRDDVWANAAFQPVLRGGIAWAWQRRGQSNPESKGLKRQSVSPLCVTNHLFRNGLRRVIAILRRSGGNYLLTCLDIPIY
jgi:hypothetical protein